MTRAALIARLKELEKNSINLCEAHQSVLAAERNVTGSALRDSEERLRAIVETAVEGIVTIDARGIIESFNPAAERMFGYAAHEMIGQNVSVLMPSPERERHDGFIQNYLRTGQARIIGIGREVQGRRKDGSLFPMDLSVSEVRLADGRMFTGILRDITARKEGEGRLAAMARSLAEKNKELETIVYVASHDLRSPLVNIQGFSQELARACETLRAALGDAAAEGTAPARAISEEIPEAVHYILSGAAKIDALLSGLLRFSRLGRAALKPERLDMGALLRSVLHAMEFQLQQLGARVELEPLPDAFGDSTQINQVFSNLVDNALKYRHPDRAPVIRVSGRTEAGQVVFAVEDNGLGIPKEHQPRVFEIFHRLDPTATEGEGLGLTIAQRSLERQGGRIWLESAPGRGSTFFVSLPSPEQMAHRQQP
jgi:PAS domain S-box-containing protein